MKKIISAIAFILLILVCLYLLGGATKNQWVLVAIIAASIAGIIRTLRGKSKTQTKQPEAEKAKKTATPTAKSEHIQAAKGMQEVTQVKSACANRTRVNQETRLLPAYTVIDLETTGLSPETDRIIEVACLRVRDHQPTADFSMLVNPQCSITPAITEITGITNEMVQDAPTIDTVLSELLRFIGDDVLIGHNIRFDLSFLSTAAKRVGAEMQPHDSIDTLRLSRKLYPELSHHRLGDMANHLGVSNTNAHRALADCETTRQIYECMMNERGHRLLEQHSADKGEHERESSNPGYEKWLYAEKLRTSGEDEAALSALDEAKAMGYIAPALFESYAKLYRKQKNYAKEIDIINEYMDKHRQNGRTTERLSERRSKAYELLLREQEAQQAAAEQERRREERNRLAEHKDSEPKKPTRRAVLQLSENMTVIRRYESIAEAVRESGVNSKSIRDAANGVQKRAGGCIWRYEDSM